MSNSFATIRPKILILFVCAFATFALASPQSELTAFGQKVANALPAGKPTVAVIPFELQQADANSLSEYLVASLVASGRVTVVERSQFHQVLSEIALSQTGVLQEEQSLQIGKALAAQYLVVGSMGDLMGQKQINLRLVETESGKVLEATTIVLGLDALSDLSKTLLGEAGQTSAAVFRSAVAPGWGQFYTDHPVQGSVALGAFLGSAGFLTYAAIQKGQANSDFQNWQNALYSVSKTNELHTKFATETGMNFSSNPNEFQQWYNARLESYNSKVKDWQSNLMLGVGLTVGSYVLNLVDATVCGMSHKKAFELYFSALPTSGNLQLSYSW